MDMWSVAVSSLGMVADLSTPWPAPIFPGLPAPKPPRAENLPKLAAALRPGLQMPQTTLTPPTGLGWAGAATPQTAPAVGPARKFQPVSPAWQRAGGSE